MQTAKRFSISDSVDPGKAAHSAEIAEQVAEYEARCGKVQTSPIREASIEDIKPATFSIQQRRG
jgi:hypothetical protein